MVSNGCENWLREITIPTGVDGVVEQHKKTGRPLAIWKNGTTVLISPNSVKLNLLERVSPPIRTHEAEPAYYYFNRSHYGSEYE